MAKEKLDAQALEEETTETTETVVKEKKLPTPEEIESIRNAISVLSGAGVLSEKMAKDLNKEMKAKYIKTDLNNLPGM